MATPLALESAATCLVGGPFLRSSAANAMSTTANYRHAPNTSTIVSTKQRVCETPLESRMSDSPSQDPYAPPPPPPPGSASTPPPPSIPPAPPAGPPVTPQYPSFGYQQTGPIPGFQNTGPVPSYAPAAQPQPVPPNPQLAAVRGAGAMFFRSLFDMSFNTYITRRLAGVFYAIGLVVIGIGAIGALFSGLAGAFAAMSSSYTAGIGVVTLFASLIGVPLIALVLVIALRLGLEAGVALIAVAENTGRSAADSDKKN